MKENIDNFIKEYEALVEKYGVNFVAYPEFTPNEKGTFDIVCRVAPVDFKEREKQTLDTFIPKA